MDFLLSSAKLTGNPSTSGWVQVHDFTPQDKEKVKVRGRLFAVIAICKQDEGIDGVISGREILARLHEEYFGDTKNSAFEALKGSVEKVIEEFGGENGRDVEIGAASFVEGVVYSVVGGGAQASIFRNGILAKILVSYEDKVTSASGYPKANDIFILGTGKFYKTFTEGVLKAALEADGLDRAVEGLAPAVHSVNDSSDLGAVFISFKEEGFYDQKPISKLGGNEKTKELKQSESLDIAKKSLLSKLEKLREKLPSRKIYIRKSMDSMEETGGKKTVMSAGLILIILLMVSIGFGIKQKKERDFRAQYIPRLSQAQHNYDEASKLIGLDADRARELFLQSKALVDTLVSEEIKDPELLDLKRKIEEGEGVVLGKYTSNPELFIDLTLFRDGFSADILKGTNRRVLVLDSKGRRIVEVDIATKKTSIVGDERQAEGFFDISGFEDKTYAITDSGIFEVEADGLKLTEKDWQGKALLYSYAANLYVLDKEGSKILRYSATPSGFSTKQEWLAPGIEPDLTNAIAWTIDGSIWIGLKNGRVLKFTQGVGVTLSIDGVSPDLTRIDDIYTDDENEFVYILDKENSRIVVLDKEGNFKAQYVSDELKRAKNISASENNDLLIFLGEDSKLYSINLNI